MNSEVLLVGAGYMGKEYAKALDHLQIPYDIVTRSKRSAIAFEQEIGHVVAFGGIEQWLETHVAPKRAIVAVNVPLLCHVASILVEAGVNEILLEKPGCLCMGEFNELASLANRNGCEIYLSYNRRFYPSVEKALDIINRDGGILSFTFEFTEWSSSVEASSHGPDVKEKWLLANSSHVIDLAFFIGGFPLQMSCYAQGGKSWHTASSVFAGSGNTEKGALFSYVANWDAPGRWGLEFCTRNNRLILRPMETLSVMRMDSVILDPVITRSEGLGLKPGISNMLKAFLLGVSRENLPALTEQIRHLDLYSRISGTNEYLA